MLYVTELVYNVVQFSLIFTDEFLQACWDEFLEGIDSEVAFKTTEIELQPGDRIPAEITITDARTNKLCDFSSTSLFPNDAKYCHVVLLRHFA